MARLTYPLILLILSLITLTSAAINPPKRAVATPSKTTRTFAERQNSRQKIIQRANQRKAKDTFNMVKRNNPELFKRGAGSNGGVSSPRVYPSCPGSKGLGYARYYKWDFYSNDLPISPYYAKPNTEENCLAKCTEHQFPLAKRHDVDSSCMGAVYVPNGPCYLKGSFINQGKFLVTTRDISTDLIGGCAAWKGTVPDEMDKVCCNM